jgi:hypothetical protein
VTVEELRARCAAQERVMLVICRKSEPKTDRMRLAGPGSPLGRYVSFLDSRRFLGDFASSDVLKWLDEGESRWGAP